MDKKSGGYRPHPAQSGAPWIVILILSLSLWAVLWLSVSSLAPAELR
jgi:hypothetical protein